MKPWLGAQEAQYASNLWHLDVPGSYAAQMDTPDLALRVFPGKSLVNTGGAGAGETHVALTGPPGAWITDMECATSMRPKLYGFDFARISEVYETASGEKRFITEKTPSERLNHPGHHKPGAVHQGEYAMMKDLMVSTLAEEGEVCLTYHMLNPFLAGLTNAQGSDVGRQLSLKSGDLAGLNGVSTQAANDMAARHLGSFNFVTENSDAAVIAARNLIAQNYTRFGAFLKDVLNHPLAQNKTIYLRLLHEPNIKFFWWGEPPAGPSAGYYVNFRALWKFLIQSLEAGLEGARTQIKYVLSLNGKSSLAEFNADLNGYLPTGSAPPDVDAFYRSIAVIGLDYYEDFTDDPAQSQLGAQYANLVARVKALNTNVLTGHRIEHALTEVSVRTSFKGKLYGRYDGKGPWPPSNRHFFQTVVKPIVQPAAPEDMPKWVMFWVNRFGNSVVTNNTPNAQGSGIAYRVRDQFLNAGAEFYYPILPAAPFYVRTPQAGLPNDADRYMRITWANNSFFRSLGGTPGVGDFDAHHKNPYIDAIADFFTALVPQARVTHNALTIKAIDQFLKGSNPVHANGPSPVAPAAVRNADYFVSL